MTPIDIPRDLDARLRRCLEALKRGQSIVDAYDVIYDGTITVGDQLTTNIAAIALLSGGMHADQDYIITGLFSYDRGALAPFGVVPGAAYVPNLDADKLDGYEGVEVAILAENEVVTGDYTFDSYTKFGTTASGHGLGVAGDVMISGRLELDGVGRFDGQTYFYDQVAVSANIRLVNATDRLYCGPGVTRYITGTAALELHDATGIWMYSPVSMFIGTALDANLDIELRRTAGAADSYLSVVGVADYLVTGSLAGDLVLRTAQADRSVYLLSGTTGALEVTETGAIIGRGSANIDYTLTFIGDDATGILTWMEDEDYFQFADKVVMDLDLDVTGTIAGAAISGTAITGTSFVIGANTLDTNEWAFLDGQDQALKIADSVEFAQVTLTGTGKTIYGAAAQSISSQDANYMDYAAATGHRFAGDVRISGADTPSVLFQETTGTNGDTFALAFKGTGSGTDSQYAKGSIIWEATGESHGRGALHLCLDAAGNSGSAVIADAVMTLSTSGLEIKKTTLVSTTMKMGTSEQFQLRDSGLYGYSPAEGIMAWVTDGTLTLGAAATNQTIISSAGRMTMIGTGRVMKTADIDVAIPKRPAANPPGQGTQDGFPTDDYDDTQEESLYLTWHVPHDYVPEGTVHLHCHFFVDTAPAGAANAGFSAEYKVVNHGDAYDFSGTSTATSTTAITTGTPANDEELHESNPIALTATGFAPGDHVLIRFFRNVAVASDFTGDIRCVTPYHIEYLSGSLGEAT